MHHQATRKYITGHNFVSSLIVIVLFFSLSCKTDTQAKKHEPIVIDTITKAIPVKRILTQAEKLDTTAQKILLIGDSQAYFLMKGLKRYSNTKGHELQTVSWVSATIETFATSDTLEHFLKVLTPSLVILSLGTNQLKITDSLKFKNDIDKIVTKLADYKAIWIGPLKSKRASVINNILNEKIEANCFFRSDSLKIPRKKGSWAHPSYKGSNVWTDSIASWIVKKSKYPILMEVAKDKKDYNFTKTVLMPPEN